MIEKQKLGNIQALRGIAAVSVVLYHLVIIEGKYGHGNKITPVWFNYGASGVDIFFVVSGLVMVMVTRGQSPSLRSGLRFLFQRLTRVYPIYWFYTLIALTVYLINPKLVNSAQGNQVDILASFLLLPSSLLPLINVGWTLVHEMYFYLVFTLLLVFIPRARLPIALVGWASVVGIGQVFCRFDAFGCGVVPSLILHPLTLEFIAGCFVGLAIFGTIRQFSRTTLMFGTVLYLAVIAGLQQNQIDMNVDALQRTILFGVPATLIVYGAVSIELNSAKEFPRWLGTLGDASYSMYLSHVPLLTLLGRLWAIFYLSSVVGNLLTLSGMFIVVILFSLFSYRWIELPSVNQARTLVRAAFGRLM